MIRKIFTFPAPVLRRKTVEITTFDEALRELAADMAETMYKAPGVGLAAPQIGLSIKLLVYDISPEDERGDYTTLVNPKIIEGRGRTVCEEGCLSVREYAANVERFEVIKVKAKTLTGEEYSFEAEDFHARVLQHEIDHLNGILFIDHLSSLKRSLYKKRLKKLLQSEKTEADRS